MQVRPAVASVGSRIVNGNLRLRVENGTHGKVIPERPGTLNSLMKLFIVFTFRIQNGAGYPANWAIVNG